MSIDILTDSDDDLLIQDGDLVFGDAEANHQADIMRTDKGHWRASVLTGCNLREFVKRDMTAERGEELRSRLRSQMLYDGYRIVLVNITSNLQIALSAQR